MLPRAGEVVQVTVVYLGLFDAKRLREDIKGIGGNACCQSEVGMALILHRKVSMKCSSHMIDFTLSLSTFVGASRICLSLRTSSVLRDFSYRH